MDSWEINRFVSSIKFSREYSRLDRHILLFIWQRARRVEICVLFCFSKNVRLDQSVLYVRENVRFFDDDVFFIV